MINESTTLLVIATLAASSYILIWAIVYPICIVLDFIIDKYNKIKGESNDIKLV